MLVIKNRIKNNTRKKKVILSQSGWIFHFIDYKQLQIMERGRTRTTVMYSEPTNGLQLNVFYGSVTETILGIFLLKTYLIIKSFRR